MKSGTFKSDISGTFVSDTSGTFGVIYSSDFYPFSEIGLKTKYEIELERKVLGKENHQIFQKFLGIIIGVAGIAFIKTVEGNGAVPPGT